MPLVWAHAEYVKLTRSLADGRVFDMPPQTVERYQRRKVESHHTIWRFNHKTDELPAGRILRVEVLQAALVHWSMDGWQTTCDTRTTDTGLGVHLVDLPTGTMPPGARLDFTFLWQLADHWEGTDFSVTVTTPVRSPPDAPGSQEVAEGRPG